MSRSTNDWNITQPNETDRPSSGAKKRVPARKKSAGRKKSAASQASPSVRPESSVKKRSGKTSAGSAASSKRGSKTADQKSQPVKRSTDELKKREQAGKTQSKRTQAARPKLTPARAAQGSRADALPAVRKKPVKREPLSLKRVPPGILVLVGIFLVCVGLLFLHSWKTSLNEEVRVLQKELNQVQSEVDSKNGKLMGTANLTQIEEQAKALGMAAAQPSQYVYETAAQKDAEERRIGIYDYIHFYDLVREEDLWPGMR